MIFQTRYQSWLPILENKMDSIHQKWDRLLEEGDQLIQVCEEVNQDLNKNRLVRQDWNEKTSEWMERFKQNQQDTNEPAT